MAADAAERRTLVELLSRSGYQVTAPGTLEEAMAALRSRDADILLLSGLSDVENDAVLTQTRLSPSLQTHVLVLSPGNGVQRVRLLDRGADDVVTIPWNEEELLARVRAQVRQKKKADAMVLYEFL